MAKRKVYHAGSRVRVLKNTFWITAGLIMFLIGSFISCDQQEKSGEGPPSEKEQSGTEKPPPAPEAEKSGTPAETSPPGATPGQTAPAGEEQAAPLPSPSEPPQPATQKAVAILYPTEGSQARGIVFFEQVQDGIQIKAEVSGLSPGPHGFHVHEFGDCSGPDGASAGNHFNPEGAPHGAPADQQRHVGDLGNLEAAGSGQAQLTLVDHRLSLSGPSSIIGRGFVIHGQADDLTSQPAGNAGPRVACGVIGIAESNPGQPQ